MMKTQFCFKDFKELEVLNVKGFLGLMQTVSFDLFGTDRQRLQRFDIIIVRKLEHFDWQTVTTK